MNGHPAQAASPLLRSASAPVHPSHRETHGYRRIALRRPYTFFVTGVLILLMGITALFRTPTDVFPAIDIPVVTVVCI
jgi:hypothetical protein